MSTKARVNLTAAAGIVTGVLLCLSEDAFGLAYYALVILVPLIVGRWWVVAALAGPLVAGVALEVTGQMPEDDSNGGLEYDFGFIFFVLYLVLSGNLMLILVGVRKGFDFLRKRRLAAKA
jgi:peptidoglycan/LPS O-acetylase OafA/YrhL